ncbi:MAG: hypothetical protein ACRBN8_14220 [Nannocystales bacterium]
MNRTTGLSFLLVALTACGPAVETEESVEEPGCDPWAEVCEVTLLPNWDEHAVLNLEHASVAVETPSHPPASLGEGRVRASIGRYLVLQSELDEPLVCLLSEPFEHLDDVPTDASICDCEIGGCWDHTALFGLIGTGNADFANTGLLLRTSAGALYRGRVLVADSDHEQSILTIEYEGVM